MRAARDCRTCDTRAAQASEPAQMVLFFASDLASFVNGEIGDCDGGIVLDG